MIAAAAVFAMVFAAGIVLLSSSSDVDGANSEIRGETNVVKIGGTLTYQIIFYETEEFETLDLTYSAVLKDSSGVSQPTAVSPSAGSLTNGLETELTITAPKVAGKYTLTVTFKEKKDGGTVVNTEKTKTVTVMEPIKLTATLENHSKVDFTDFAVYFVVDGERVDDSKTLISVASGSTTAVSYDWVTESLSNGEHRFAVVAGEENIGNYMNVKLGDEGKFWVGHYDYGLFNILVAILLVVLVLTVIYFYRKPVKNYGKPKSRR